MGPQILYERMVGTRWGNQLTMKEKQKLREANPIHGGASKKTQQSHRVSSHRGLGICTTFSSHSS